MLNQARTVYTAELSAVLAARAAGLVHAGALDKADLGTVQAAVRASVAPICSCVSSFATDQARSSLPLVLAACSLGQAAVTA